MRDIKFRGLGTDGHWRYGELSPEGEYHINLATFFANVHGGAIRPETIGEWTGLKGKNGIEIYEGDIVRDYHGKILRVDWAKYWARYMMSFDGMICLYYLEDYNHNKPDCLAANMEVIGDIYTNPELLKEV